MSDTIMFPPPPPEGLNYIAAIRPSLNFILVLTPLGSVLVPLILTLYFFSTPNSRRHPVFILNILACCSGICEAAINAALEVKQIIYPLEPVSPSLLTAVIAFSTVSPLFIDSILLFRILAFYPPYRTPRRTLIAIFALPLLVKCGRFTAVVMYLHSFTHSSGRLPSILLAAESTWPKNPYIITEWTLQMTDNTYASAFFLYKIYQLRKTDKDVPIIRNGSFLSYIRSLFMIALGNFIFPVIMNIASLVLIVTDPSFIDGSYILLTNNYVSIIGVVFATIWTRKQNWNLHHSKNSEGSKKNSLDEDQNQSLHNNFVFDPSINVRSVQLSTLQFERTEASTATTRDNGGVMDISPTSSGEDLEKGKEMYI